VVRIWWMESGIGRGQRWWVGMIRLGVGGGGATRPLPRDEGMEELHGGPTVGPRPKVCTRGQKWKK